MAYSKQENEQIYKKPLLIIIDIVEEASHKSKNTV